MATNDSLSVEIPHRTLHRLDEDRSLPMCICFLLFACSAFCQSLHRSLFQLLGRLGAIVGEVPRFDVRVVLPIYMRAPEAPTDNLVGIDLGTSAVAMRCRRLAYVCCRLNGGICVPNPFENAAICLKLMSGAGAKLHGAIVMVVAFHG